MGSCCTKIIGSQSFIIIKPNGITNGVVKLQLLGKFFSVLKYHKIADYASFRLQYRILPTDIDCEWKSISFTLSYIRKQQDVLHISVKVNTNLYDYFMEFRLAVMFTRNNNYAEIKVNKWLLSNIININIPSSMNEKTFNINDGIYFLLPNRHDEWSYGVIKQISYYNNDLNMNIQGYGVYNIFCIDEYQLEHQYKIKYDINNITIKPVSTHIYIDLTNDFEIDKLLLIGDRIAIAEDVYFVLNDILSDNYLLKPDDDYIDIDFISMSKFIALNIINFLWIRNDRGYKIKCFLNNNINNPNNVHYNDKIELIQQREYIIGRSINCGSDAQDTTYYCDLCLCRQGDYYWMYRCQKYKNHKYDGHDLCLSCIYTTIKRYNQLRVLLKELLINELTNDVIQTVLIYVAGDVVKLS